MYGHKENQFILIFYSSFQTPDGSVDNYYNYKRQMIIII